MPKILFSLLIVIAFAACEKPELEPVEPTEPICNLDVTVRYCTMANCADEMFLYDITVQLFATREDAIDGINELESRKTDANGKASVSNLSFHDVLFVKNYFYDANDEASPIQSHISLEFPVVGMTSIYRYFENPSQASFTPDEYEDNYLSVTLVNQLDEFSFIVQEEVQNTDGFLGSELIGQGERVVRNIWTITDNEVVVTPFDDENFISYVWGLSDFYQNTEIDGFTFSLNRPAEVQVDMASNSIQSIQNLFGTTALEDYNIFGRTYDNLIGDLYNYTYFDGPSKFRVYNKVDGPVRSLFFFTGDAVNSFGFDLVL